VSVSEFDAFRIFEDDGMVAGRLVRATLDELNDGEVVIRTGHTPASITRMPWRPLELAGSCATSR
jgi:hypothetical protein